MSSWHIIVIGKTIKPLGLLLIEHNMTIIYPRGTRSILFYYLLPLDVSSTKSWSLFGIFFSQLCLNTISLRGRGFSYKTLKWSRRRETGPKSEKRNKGKLHRRTKGRRHTCKMLVTCTQPHKSSIRETSPSRETTIWYYFVPIIN